MPDPDLRASGEAVAIAAEPIDDSGKQWIELLPTTEKARNGPYYFTLESDDLEAYAAYLREHPGDIAVDRDHDTEKGGSTRAAGWFTGEAEVRESDDGPRLWAQVEWSKSGLEDVEGKEYRFVSASFSFHKIDTKTKLMTKAKEILRATLTNNPFFKELSALAATVWDATEGLENVREIVKRALNGSGDTYRYWVMDIAPGKALVRESSSGKTFVVPFTIKGDEAELTPASDWAEAEQEWVEAALAAHDAAVKARAAGEEEPVPAPDSDPPPPEDKPDGDPVPKPKEEAEMPDLKSLAAVYGLSEDATDDEIMAAARAAKEKADKVDDIAVSGLSLEDISELRTQAAAGAQAEKRLNRLEIDNLLDGAVRDFKILPSQKDGYRAMADKDFASVAALIDATPVDALKLAAQGFDTPQRAQEEKDVKATVEAFESDEADGVDTDSARTHVRAEEILLEQGKAPGSYTDAEYLNALAQAGREA